MLQTEKSKQPLTQNLTIPTVSTAKACILVQDDEEPILEIMCSMLTASGYKCLKAASPKKAWAILTFDIVMRDRLNSDFDDNRGRAARAHTSQAAQANARASLSKLARAFQHQMK